MKLLVAVVRDEFAANLTDKLATKGFGATKLASTGGFLKAGNTTFLIGVPVEQLDEAMGLIQASCPAKPAKQPDGVTVSGAAVFVLDVENMHKV